MKKLSLIFLALVYLIPAIGFSVSAHYCGGKLSSLSLTTSGESCLCGSKKNKRKCCESKNFSFKIKDSQQTSALVTWDFKIASFQSLALNTKELSLQPSLVESLENYNHSPPQAASQPLFLLNRVFRI